MASYIVTAAMVTALSENNRVVYLYKGDLVPEGLAKESIEHLKGLGFVKAGSEPVGTILPVDPPVLPADKRK